MWIALLVITCSFKLNEGASDGDRHLNAKVINFLKSSSYVEKRFRRDLLLKVVGKGNITFEGECHHSIPLVSCEVNHCDFLSCPNFPTAECHLNLCGKCEPVFYFEGKKIDCYDVQTTTPTLVDSPKSVDDHLPPCFKERKKIIQSKKINEFIVDCELNGSYKPIQCWPSVGVCWCVNSNGEELFGTRKFFPNKPSCENLVEDCRSKEYGCCQDNKTAARGLHYEGCSSSVSKCEKLRSLPMHFNFSFRPQCDDNGYFNSVQCWDALNQCWCVNKDGLEIKGSRVNGKKPDCSEVICEDKSNDCHKVVVVPEFCLRLNHYAKDYCRKSCGYCPVTCEDKSADCKTFLKVPDFCAQLNQYAKEHCRKSCGYCSETIPTNISPIHLTPVVDDIVEYQSFCEMPPASGPCTSGIIKFFYNPVKKECEQFFYGGCLGNENNFDNATICLHVCDKKANEKETVTSITSLPTESTLTENISPSLSYESTASYNNSDKTDDDRVQYNLQTFTVSSQHDLSTYEVTNGETFTVQPPTDYHTYNNQILNETDPSHIPIDHTPIDSESHTTQILYSQTSTDQTYFNHTSQIHESKHDCATESCLLTLTSSTPTLEDKTDQPHHTDSVVFNTTSITGYPFSKHDDSNLLESLDLNLNECNIRNLIVHKISSIQEIIKPNPPNCTSNGNFADIQCGINGYCWCVDQDGNEIEETRSITNPKCPKLKICRDIEEKRKCSEYNGRKYCKLYTNFMKERCPKTCGFCSDHKRPGCESKYGCCDDGVTPKKVDAKKCPSYKSICDMPVNTGTCKQQTQSFYYSHDDKECKTFVYSGCNGNMNNFLSKEECLLRCWSHISNLTLSLTMFKRIITPSTESSVLLRGKSHSITRTNPNDSRLLPFKTSGNTDLSTITFEPMVSYNQSTVATINDDSLNKNNGSLFLSIDFSVLQDSSISTSNDSNESMFTNVEPTASYDQPVSVNVELTASNDQPVSNNFETTASNDQSMPTNVDPTASNDQSMFTNVEPTASNDQPVSNNVESTASNDQSMSNNFESTASNDQSMFTNVDPKASNDQPVSNNFEPTASNDQSMSTNVDPTASNDQSMFTNVEPTASNDQPVSNNFETTAFNDQSMSTNVDPTASNDQSMFTNVEPTASNDQPVSNNVESTASNDHSMSNNFESTASNDHSISINVEPTTSNDQPVSKKFETTASNDQFMSTNIDPTDSNGQLVSDNFEPSASYDQPVSINVEPTASYDQSVSINVEPAASKDRAVSNNVEPTVFNDQPVSNNFEPTASNDHSMLTNVEPKASNDQSVSINFKLTASNDQSISTNIDPTASNDQPVSDNFEPTASNDQSMFTNVEPTASNDQPVSNNFEPTASNDQSASNNFEATASYDQPVSNKFEQTASYDQPVSNNVEPTASNDQPVFNNVEPTASYDQPVSINFEPTALNDQLLSINVEPASFNDHPVSINIEPTASTDHIVSNIPSRTVSLQNEFTGFYMLSIPTVIDISENIHTNTDIVSSLLSTIGIFADTNLSPINLEPTPSTEQYVSVPLTAGVSIFQDSFINTTISTSMPSLEISTKI